MPISVSSARDYKLVVRLPKTDGPSPDMVVIWPGHPESKGWMETCREQLDQAASLELLPAYRDLPTVHVRLGEGRKWVYYRIVQGTITNGEMEQKRILHCVGYREHVGERNVNHILRVDGETGIITLGEE